MKGLFDDLIPKAPEAPGFWRGAADTGVALAKGAAMGGKMLADAFGADNAVSRVAGDAIEGLQGLESAYSRWEQEQSAREMQAASESGSTWEEVKAAGRAFARRPIDFTAEAVGTSLPTLAAAFLPGGQGAAIIRIGAMLGLGGAQGAGAVKSQIHDAVRDEWVKAGATEEEAAQRAQAAQEYFGQNSGQIALGTALGAAAGTLGAEANILSKRILGNAAQPAAEGASLLQRAGASLPGRVAVQGVKEAAPEALQGGQEQLAGNLALRNEGFDVDPMQGVAGNATLEALGGFGAGGLAELATPGPDPMRNQAMRDLADAPDADTAIDAFQRAVALPAPATASDWEVVDGVRALPGPPGAPGSQQPTALLPSPDGQVFIADEAGNVVPQPASQRAEAITRQTALMELARQRQAEREALGKQTPRGAEPQPPAPAPIPVGDATELVPAGEATEVEPIPAGEATELIDTGDAAELPRRIPVGKATEIEPELIEAPGARDGDRGEDPPDAAAGAGGSRVPDAPAPGGAGAVRGESVAAADAPAGGAGRGDRPGGGAAGTAAALSEPDQGRAALRQIDAVNDEFRQLSRDAVAYLQGDPPRGLSPNAPQELKDRWAQYQRNREAARQAYYQAFGKSPDGKPVKMPAATQATDLMTADGKPYGTRSAAAVRAKKEGGEVVEVDGGWVVRVSAQAGQRQPVTRESALPDGVTVEDGQGQRYRVHYQRNDLVIAHPIVDGKPQVSRDTSVRFWTSPDRTPSGESDRTDPIYPVTDDEQAPKPASWVIRERATGKVVMETFDEAKVRALNTEKYEAVPIQGHLASLNRKPAEDADQKPAARSGSAQVAAKRHPATVMGSPLLAAVSRAGGLDPAWLAEFSTRFETARRGKDGRPIIQWRNPLVPGIGRLFRRGGTQDLQRLAEIAEENGYLEPGAVEADTKEAGERAKDMIRAALNRQDVQTLDEQLAEEQEAEAAERDAWYAELAAESAAELEAERQAIMAEAELTPEEAEALDDIPWDAPGSTDRAAAMRALGFTDEEIADGQEQGQAVGAEEAARAAPQGSAEGRAPGADPAAAPQREEGTGQGLSRDPDALPEGVRRRVENAVERLQSLRRELLNGLDAFGKGARLDSMVEDRLPAISKAREALDEFRKHAERNGFDAEAIIEAMGGDIRLREFASRAEPAAAPEPAPEPAPDSAPAIEPEPEPALDPEPDDAPDDDPLDNDMVRARSIQARPPWSQRVQEDQDFLAAVVDSLRREVTQAIEGGATFASAGLEFTPDGDMTVLLKDGLRLAYMDGRRTRDNVLAALRGAAGDAPVAPQPSPAPAGAQPPAAKPARNDAIVELRRQKSVLDMLVKCLTT